MRYALKNYLWMRKFGYKPCSHTEYTGRSTIKTHGIIRVPINILRIRIRTHQGLELRKIENTPHFKWIKSLVIGSEDETARRRYHEYVDTYFPNADADAAVKKRTKLVESIISSGYDDSDITIITGRPKRRRRIGPYFLYIIDGAHRAACAMALDHKYLQCRLYN